MNTQSTQGERHDYLMSQYDIVLRNRLIAQKICSVDTGDKKYIENPYGNQVTATTQAVAGTYSVSSWTVTDDALTVTDEVIYSEHIFAHEEFFAVFDIASSRLDEMMYGVAAGIDKFVLNNLCEDATASYSTPAGGFAAANILTIISNVASKFMGYADTYKGLYMVIEAQDVPGFIQAEMLNGFSYADSALNNGFVDNIGGFELYVVQDGTFVSATLGSTSVTNDGHRVAGVKNVSTYASPRGMNYEEKPVTGKTGREVVVYQLVGFKLWAQKAALTCDITVTA